MHQTDANPAAVAVQSFFRDRLLGTRYVNARARRQGRHREWGCRSDCFRIGSTRRVDAPAAEAVIGGPEHALVTVDRFGAAVLHLTSRMSMTGRISRPEGTQALTGEVTGAVTIVDGSSAEVRCGAMTFRIATTAPLPAVDVAPVRWSWQRQRYALVVALATATVAGLVAFVPPDRKALALDFDGAAARLDRYLIRAPEVRSPPAAAVDAGGQRAIEDARRGAASADPGRTGRPDARKAPRAPKLAIKGDTLRFEVRESPAPVTLVSLIGRTQSAAVRSIFSRGQALGPDAEMVLDSLQGDPSQSASLGLGGLDVRGTGARAAGEGDGIIGPGGPLTSIGPGRRDGVRSFGTGDPIGRLPGHRQQIVTAITDTQFVARGTLDKEIVRRIIRAHLNEVRFCYEQELPRHPTLSGRVVIQFAITPGGQVASSAVQDSTLHLASLEGCMTQAVRRWTFPQPQGGGGLTIVSYPFVLSPAGG
ncbi:MAG TPA: AgmX/PglI C-terminal domain-containing protein [Polyangia bacterium]|nr:AgmX/PglI C-terminal domain-containing protein [Polyangia bacterium]